jgi:peptide/nickel transport system substrate-binding protein
VVAVAAILFAACQEEAITLAPSTTRSAASRSSASAEPPPHLPSAAIKEGGQLVVAIPRDIAMTDPALTSDSNSSYVMRNVMEGLVALKPGSTNEIVPALSTGWTISPDGLTYTFDLRTGVKFHDGTDFNADAVVYNYERWKTFPTALQPHSHYAGQVLGGYGASSNVASVSAPGANQVVINLKKPNSSFLIAQTLAAFGISSPTALKAGGADNTILDVSKIAYARGGPPAMVGTGPFAFMSWTAGNNVTIHRNPNYWNAHARAHLDEVIFKPVNEEAAILNGLQNGEVDLAQNVAPVDVATLTANPKLQLIDRGDSCNIAQLAMNQAYKPMSDRKIREAIAHAVDKQAYAAAFYAGQGVSADNWMPLDTPYAKALGLPTYDSQKASDAIAASGETDLTIDFYYPFDVTTPYMPEPKALAKAIARDLKAVGFKVVLHPEAWSPDYLDQERAGNFEMSLIGRTCDWGGADNFLKTESFGYINGNPSPEFAYRNDELQQTMNGAIATTDEPVAKQLWEHAQDLLRADLPTVPLVTSAPPVVAKAYVMGFVGSGALNEYLNSVWLDK